VAVVSLGCAKNLVDTEIMLGALLQAGLAITNDPRRAAVVIVNTCSFIDEAQAESVDAILECAAMRDACRRTKDQGLIVAGCLPQRFRDELPRLLPEVDAFIGVDQVTSVAETVRLVMARRAERQRQEDQPGRTAQSAAGGVRVRRQSRTLPARGRPANRQARPAPPVPLLQVHRRPTYVPDYATARFRLTPRHFAYVKIAEGCNHPCSFCTIPRLRGRHRSRLPADIVEEARRLLAEGVKELNLISQDATYYGRDLHRQTGPVSKAAEQTRAWRVEAGPGPTLSALLEQLQALPGDFWIRLLYTHPAHWTDRLIQTIADCPKVARYADIPLQHIDGLVLQRMRRETSSRHLVDLLARIRAGIPGIALRTTFIVGFPGETERQFKRLLAFVREARFERLGVFTYSREKGTVAGKMADQLPDAVKRQRRDQVMAAQLQVSREFAASQCGRTLRVLVETAADDQTLQRAGVASWEHGLLRDGREAAVPLSSTAVAGGRGPGSRYLVARGEADAPDIDGRVYVRGLARIGEFAQAQVIGHADYDLIAKVL
jgi:ribosomal protein S12 methylthiotransferase